MKATTFRNTVLLAAASAVSAAQNITIPATNGAIPAPGANGCAEGYFPGTDTVIFTVPYTYKEVISIIGNYTNLTWSGSPANSVTTNNSAALQSNDWTPGSARTYDLAGAHVIETITTYEKPENGPTYIEIHTLAPLAIAAENLTTYASYDGQNYTEVCGGKAMWANYTINYCTNNVTVASGLLHMLHLTDAMTVGKFLGGQNFTSCEALNSTGSAPLGGWGGVNGTSNETTPTTGSPSSSSTGSPSSTAVANAGAANMAGSIVGYAAAFVGLAAFAAAL